MLLIDIYFTKKYCEVSQLLEEGECVSFSFSNEFGEIQYNFIKREIDVRINGKLYYDIITPYGYGGPQIVKSYDKEKLIKTYKDSFKKFCLDNRIISEFTRWHPITKNYLDFKNVYELQYSRQTVGTNLKDFDDPFLSEFSKSRRNIIRRLIKEDYSYEVIDRPKDLSDFINIYYSTMDRRNTSEFYYFGEKYFNELLSKLNDNILLVNVYKDEKTVSSGLYFKYNNFLHDHLSGTLTEYLQKSPAYLAKYAITEWGKLNEYDVIHHGGGLTEDEDDNLLQFKRKFGNNTEFEFYISKKIWDIEIYRELCTAKKIDIDVDFFPAYRQKNN